MNYNQAKLALHKICKCGYVPYHRGIVCQEDSNGRVSIYGINIDGDGHDGRLFGCPQIIWDQEHFNEFFNFAK